MQKVEGSSPFSRSQKAPQIAGFFVALRHRVGRAGELGIRIGHQTGAQFASVSDGLPLTPVARGLRIAAQLLDFDMTR